MASTLKTVFEDRSVSGEDVNANGCDCRVKSH